MFPLSRERRTKGAGATAEKNKESIGFVRTTSLRATVVRLLKTRIGGASVAIGRDTAGSVAVELAIAAPFLLLLVIGIIDFSSYMNNYQTIAAATRIGAEYALNGCGGEIDPTADTIASSCATGIEDATSGAAPFTPALTVSSPALVCQCDDGTKANPSTTDGCGGTPPYSCVTNSRGTQRVFITVSATQKDVTPLIPWPGFPTSVKGFTQVRLQ